MSHDNEENYESIIIEDQICLSDKTTFALVVALPTFLVGLTLGMGILFLYAYCKANRSGVSDQGHDQNMYDPEYAKDVSSTFHSSRVKILALI